jgi:phospholipase/lecithinase/hemolysin
MIHKKMGQMFAALLVVLLGHAFAGIAAAHSRIVTFGDSVTDPGNAFTLLHTVALAPFEPIPTPPYAIGGHHYSNGATWVEQLGNRLGLNPSPGPAFQHPVVFSNYAVGSSRARPVGPVHLSLLVGRFFADFGGVAPADALYVIHIGGDDLQDALAALATDPSGATSIAIITDALTAIQANIIALASAGAGTFLIPNAPDFALVPAVRAAGPGAQAAGTFFAVTFNTALETMLSGLEAALGVKIFRLDIFALIHESVSAPAAFGLTEVEDFCITPFTRVSPYCSQPDAFLFWDAIHPTRVGHAIITDRALDALSAP